MLPTTFTDFFLTSVGASASFIGLLFVALSVVFMRNDGKSADEKLEFRERRLAESSFTGLANIFFLSLMALLPDTNVGYVAIILAFFGIRSALRIFKSREGDIGIAWLLASFAIYGFQIFYAVRIISDPANVANYYAISDLIIILFGGALLRAWELVGMRGEH